MSVHPPLRLASALFLAFFMAATPAALASPHFRRGDCNDDGQVGLSDGVAMLQLQFGGGNLDIPCRLACDFNASGGLTVTTAVYLFNFLFGGGAAIPPPFPGCGLSASIPGVEAVGCERSHESCPPVQPPLLSNTLYLAFEGNLEDAYGMHDGTAVGGVGFSPDNVFGDRGQSLLLDGVDDRVAIPGDTIDLRSNFTVSAWIRTDADDVNGVIFAEGYSQAPFAGSRSLYVRKGDGRLVYESEETGRMTSSFPVNDGEWHHVLVLHNFTDPFIREPRFSDPGYPRREGGTARMFINGIRDQYWFDLWLHRTREAVGDLHIGGVPQGAASFPDFNPEDPSTERNHFRGNIDEFRIFDGEIVDNQVLQVGADFVDLESGELPTCDADDTSVATIDVVPRVDDGRANVFRVIAGGAEDASGDPILYRFVAKQVGGPPHEHGLTRVIGPQETPFYLREIPDFEDFPAEMFPGNEAEFTLWEGEYEISVEVTDKHNFICQGQPIEGMDDNRVVAASTIRVGPLPGGEMKRAPDGEGVKLWIEAENFTRLDPLEGFWETIAHPGGFGGKVLRRVNTTPGGRLGQGSCGGRLTYEFNLDDAGGEEGTYYVWFRQINPSNQSDFLISAADLDDANVPGEPGENGLWYGRRCENGGFFSNADDRILENETGPGFFWQRGRYRYNTLEDRRNGVFFVEGDAKELQDGDNAIHLFHRQGGPLTLIDAILITDDPDYVPTDMDYLDAVPIGGP